MCLSLRTLSVHRATEAVQYGPKPHDHATDVSVATTTDAARRLSLHSSLRLLYA
jgi:hypothetical protein